MSDQGGIRSWALEDRPREKLLLKGKNALSDAELIAIILRTGTKSKTALQMAMEVLQRAGNNLDELGKLEIHELEQIKGMGTTKAVTLAAVLELGRRRKNQESLSRVAITSSRAAYEYIRQYLEDLPHEEFYMILLNRANRIIRHAHISKGGTSGTVVDNKIVFAEALRSKASALIVCHNHPSGNMVPSESDIALTRKIAEACKLLDMTLLDHLIIGHNKYYSLKDEGDF